MKVLFSIGIAVALLLIIGYVRDLRNNPKPDDSLNELSRHFEEQNKEVKRLKEEGERPCSHGFTVADGQDNKAEVFYPCIWEDYNDKNAHTPTLIKQLVLKKSRTFIAESIDVSITKATLSAQWVSKIRQEGNLQKSVEKLGRFMSCRSLTINDKPADEVIIKRDFYGNYTYSMMVHIYHKKTILTLTYLVGGEDETEVTTEFYNNQEVFRSLAAKTIL